MIRNINEIRHDAPIEYLLNNIIDEDLQAALFPLRISQKIFLLTKYRIKNNFVTPNTKTEYIKFFIGAAVLMSINIYRFNVNRTILISSSTTTLFFLVWFDFMYYCVAIIFIYIESAYQSNNSVLFIIKLQQALRTINFNKTIFFRDMKFWNWIFIISLLGFYLVYNFPAIFSEPGFGFITMLPVLFIDLNVVTACRNVSLANNCLVSWNNKMAYYKKVYLEQTEFQTENNVSETAMVKAYRDIIKAFCLTEKVYRFGISNLAVGTFIHVMICLQSIIEFTKLDSDLAAAYATPLTLCIASIWIMKNIVLITTLSIACDKFYKNVAEVDAFCSGILLIEESDLRRTCKNVLRFNRASFRALRTCGVVAVDAALPLRLLAVVLTYTVVLLQFAFL